MAVQPSKRYTVQRIAHGAEGDLEAALNALGDGETFEVLGQPNGDLLLLTDAGPQSVAAADPTAGGDTSLPPAASS